MDTESKTNRIRRITESVQKAIDGDYSSRIETSEKDDNLDRLAETINRMFGIVRERSSENRQTEAALRDSEEKHRRLKETIPGMVYLFARHPDGIFYFPYVNDNSRQMFDIPPEDLMQDATRLTGLIHPDDRERFDVSVQQSADTLQPWREILRHIVNGKVRWYDCMSRPELQLNGDILWYGIMLEITERMKALESLKESERNLSNIISASPIGIAIYDDSGKCIVVNDSLAGIIGISKQQMLNQNYGNVASWKKSGLLDTAKKVVKTQTAKRHDGIAISCFEKELFLDCHLVPFGNSGLLFMAQDIKARKRAEMKLQMFQFSIDQASDAVFWLKRDGGFSYVNEEACRSLGYTREELMRLHLWDIDPVFPKASWGKEWEQYQQNRIGSQHIETFHRRKDGSTFPIEVSSKHIWFGESEFHVAFVRNATARKQAEEELHRAKAYAEKLIKSANAMIVVVDASGQIQAFNPAAEKITGYTRQELIGHNLFEVLVPKDKYSGVWGSFQQSLKNGLPRTFEYPIVTQSGEKRFISWQNTELLQKGIFAGSISYGVDITERKQLEEQLLQSKKMEAIGQLAGGVAHDFNNMLSVILGHVELIKCDLPPDHPLLKNALEIEKAGLHSRNITRQLLAFSRKQIIAPKVADLNLLISNTKKTLSQLMGENIELRFLPEKDLWKVRVDPSQIDQILITLSDNTRDAMPDGGMLTIETSNVYLDDVYCSFHPGLRPGHYVLLAITDDGAGMDKEMLSHVFEPFFTTKDVGKGTGLGLATVYGIVKQNKGFINVYSEPEKGTAFNIYIPKITDEFKEEEVSEDVPSPLHSETILLVEDDEIVRKMTTTILKKMGYSVVAAETPLEALTLCENEDGPLDLLIANVVTAQMNGTELRDKIKMTKPGINVLFMSGYTTNVLARHGVLPQGAHFIQKPFNMTELSQKIRDALENGCKNRDEGK